MSRRRGKRRPATVATPIPTPAPIHAGPPAPAAVAADPAPAPAPAVSPVPAEPDATKPRPTRDQQLLAEVETVFRRFMHYPHDHAYTVSALLVAHTHLRDQEGTFLPRVTPRGYTGSKTAGCGKTTDLELKTLMSYNGTIILEPTEPALVSALHNDKSTVGLTEIDLFFGSRGTSKSAHRAIINGGYKRGATRPRERNGQTEKRNVHGPMFLDGKNAHRFLEVEGPFDTIRSRSIPIILEKKPKGARLDEYDSERDERRLQAISARLTMWGKRYGREIVRRDVNALMVDLDNRDREIWRVLFQIAAHIDPDCEPGGWVERIQAAAQAMVLGKWGDADSPQLTFAEEVLHACREAFRAGESFLPTRVLLQRLMAMDGWWRNTGGWTNPRAASMGLAAELGTFGIEKCRGYVNGVQERGYSLIDLLDVPDDPDDVADEPDAADEWDWSELDDEDD